MDKINDNLPIQYLFFVLDGERYAVKADRVQEIVDYVEITRVPMANRCIRGVTNIRGDLIPVIDLKKRFGFADTVIKKRTSFIIINILNKQKSKTVPIAVMVDIVNEVDDIISHDILPTPQFGTKVDEIYIENMIRYEDEYITALDVASLLNLDELSKI